MASKITTEVPSGLPDSAAILATTVDWSRFTRAGLISDADSALIAIAADSSKLADQADKEGGGALVANALIKVINGVTDDAALKYALALTSTLLLDSSERAHWFAKGGLIDGSGLLRLLSTSEDAFISVTASQSLSVLLSVEPSLAAQATLVDPFIAWIKTHLESVTRSPASTKLTAALAGLVFLLRNKKLRELFWQAKGLRSLALCLNANLKPQPMYEAAFAVWTISYVPEAASEFSSKNSTLLAGVSNVLKLASKDKIVRVCLGTLRNLLNKDKFNEEMIDCKLLKQLQTLAARTWSDTDIPEDLEVLLEQLKKDYQVLSNFDRYHNEVLSGKLEWGPTHTEMFWKENVKKLEKEDFAVIKVLIGMLGNKSLEPQVIAIACFDIGEFIRYYPNGKNIVKALGAKGLIMELLKHSNKELAGQALLCCSKMMVSNWEFIDTK